MENRFEFFVVDKTRVFKISQLKYSRQLAQSYRIDTRWWDSVRDRLSLKTIDKNFLRIVLDNYF